MTRAEMLERLAKIEYTELWPDDDWKDIGYTELQIWINGNGYGYFGHDDQSNCYMLTRISDEKWRIIREKLSQNRLSIDDVKGTSLANLYIIDYIINDSDPNEQYDLNEILQELLRLPMMLGEYFYCAETCGDYRFFNTEKEVYESVKRDECDFKWEELSDDELSEWIKRLESIDVGIGFICE